jgi:hypothetical protein
MKAWLGPLRPHLLLLYLLILVGSVLRIREPFLHNPIDHIFSDPGRHWEHARETLSVGPWAVIDAPIFQMWLSIVQKWSLGAPPLIAAYAGLLSAVTPWCWYCFLRDSLHSRPLALAGWAALVWLPSWIAIFSYFMMETLFLPLLGASLWLTVRARRKCTVSSFCAMVALWTLTGLTRGIAVPLGGLAALWAWLGHPNKVRAAVGSLLVVLFMTVPIAIRNHDFLTLWSPIGTGWPNQIYAESGKQSIHLDLIRDGAHWIYEFGSPSLYQKQLLPLSNWETKRAGVVKIFVDLRKGSEDWQSAYLNNAAHGWERFRLRCENLVLVMLGQSWPDNNPEFLVARAALGMRWLWAPLFLLVMGAAVARPRQTLARPLLPLLIATWFAFQAVSLVVVNEGRYRKPLEGLLIAQALVLLDSGLRFRKRFASSRTIG